MTDYLYALDLSMSCTGIAIFDLKTRKCVFVDSHKTRQKDSHGLRLRSLRNTLEELTTWLPPKEIAIERGFSKMNITTQVIYRVHGVANELFCNYPQYYYPPTTVKKAILHGRAKKEELQEKISTVYPQLKFKNDDESDAVAVGLTHLIKEYGMEWE